MRKVAIVTGGNRGIGLAIIRNMVRDGYVACTIGTSDESVCKPAFDEMRAQGGELFYFRGSIASDADRRAFVEEVVKRYGRVDVLVNNAGVAPKNREDVLVCTEESFDRVVGINVKGTLFMTQLVAREMLRQAPCEGRMRGVIVNISSFSSFVSSPNRAEYCVSKAGVSMLTRLFADRLAGEGIYVYEVQPGVIRTDMTSAVVEKYDRLLAGPQFPIHRWGLPQDVADAVSIFTSGKLAYSTGEVLHVDGGYMNIRSI